MDITKFNKELKTKVSIAKSYEKRNEIDSAIKLWLEISEMTLKFSKSRNIEAIFRNMLINRTKGIVEHIKNLKTGQIEKVLLEEEIITQDEEMQDVKLSKNGEDKVLVPPEDESKKKVPREPEEGKSVETVEDSEYKNLPKGFKELKTSTDYTIVTPHNEDYAKKHLAKYADSDVLKQQKENKMTEDRFEFEKPADDGSLICFACGYDKNSKNSKICKSCGTELNQKL